MTSLYRRNWSVTVGSVDVSQMDLSFQAMRSTKREPNTAEVKIYNLSRSTRSAIESLDSPRLVLRAGYEGDGDDAPVLFVGDTRRVFTEADGVDVITTLQARDGGRLYQAARINKAYGPGTPVVNVVRDVVDAMGIGKGNLEEFSARYVLRNGTDTFPDGYVASGPVRVVLNNLVRGAGLRWSIQNNSLQLMFRRTPLQTRATLISSDTGMVGSPTKGEKRTVSVTTLLLPGLDPGRRVSLQSRIVEGEFEVKRVEYIGDTRGNDWYANLQLRAIL